jgi:hypothetical protein
VEEAWPRVRVKTLPTSVSEVNLGSDVEVNVKVALDTLSPEDVSVQIADRQSGRTGPIAGAGHHGHGMQRA